MIRSISDSILRIQAIPPVVTLVARLVLLAVIDVFAVQLVAALYDDGNWFLAVAVAITLLLVNVINLAPNTIPLRWMTPSLALLVLVAVYPLIYTLFVSTTNFKDGHRFTKVEAIELLEQRRFLPAGEVSYYWSPYVDEAGNYALWLVSATGGQHYFVEQGEPLQAVEPFASGDPPYTESARQFPDGLPATFEGYMLAEGPAFFQAMQALDPQSGTLKDTQFGDESSPIGISGRSEAGNYQQRWIYDEDEDVLIDRASYVEYKADLDQGLFIAPDGTSAPVDFRVPYNSSDTRRTRAEAVELLEQERYLVEGSTNYDWVAYRDEAGDYALWLQSDDRTYFAIPGQPLMEDPVLAEAPESFERYQRLNSGATMQALVDPAFKSTNFGSVLTPIFVKAQEQAGDYRQRWVYSEETETLTDLTRNKLFFPDPATGDFVAADDTTAPLGYWVNIGPENYTEVFTSTLIDGPLFQIFLWTLSFAFFSVLTAFAMGLFMAVILTDDIRGVRYIRSMLLIPWAIPGMIGILMWRGMLNGRVGVIPATMLDLFDYAPPFLTDPLWAKLSILLVNLWFAYPYFMLITSGALQSIPGTIYEAAEVDGASRWDKFWNLTLPLLLVSVGPLLIASFIFNFNNYLLIEALTEGNPRIPGTNAPPVGYTDNLMTYTYRYAFSADGTRNFGFAAAIAVMIFLMVAFLTLIQFRLTRRWEEIGENV
ncbi:MAG: ABC transporter permease subunit [Chloroflexi bacterium]|nr:ABC transporter permease subunit [Chloroflexota bacterium]